MALAEQGKPSTLTFRSALSATAQDVWRDVTSLKGINAELKPMLSMESVGDITHLDQLAKEDGSGSFVVCVKAAGIVPMGRTTIDIIELDEMRFVESSDQPGMKSWRHERRVQPAQSGCILTDLLTFRPRIAPRLTGRFVDALFRSRHRYLRRRWGPLSS